MAGKARELASAMADLSPTPTHYDRLGVSPQATMAQIREAFEAWQAAQASSAAAVPASPEAHEAVDEADRAVKDAVAEMRLAYAVVSEPLRRRVYDEYLISQRKVSAHAGRWWRRPGFGRAATGWSVALMMLATIGYVGLLIWRLF